MSTAATAPRRNAPARRPTRLELAVVARRRRGIRILTMLAIVVAIVAIFGSVVFHGLIVQNQSRLDDADARLSDLELQRQNLQVELAELADPERLKAFATGRLGMIEPEPGSIVTLEPVSAGELGQPRPGLQSSGDARAGQEP
jgi:cell division protein FtsL